MNFYKPLIKHINHPEAFESNCFLNRVRLLSSIIIDLKITEGFHDTQTGILMEGDKLFYLSQSFSMKATLPPTVVSCTQVKVILYCFHFFLHVTLGSYIDFKGFLTLCV